VVSKIGILWEKEFAMGALAGVECRSSISRSSSHCVSRSRMSERQQRLHERNSKIRESLYRGGRPPLELEGKIVIVVDDGIATGCSILAAVAAIRGKSPGRVVVAVPVAPASGCSAIRMEGDEVISVAEPEMFVAISQWYEDFTQISDRDVQRLVGTPVSSMPRAA